MQPGIADYAFLSDCQSAALVADGGSVDWWCVPRFDSPSVFGALLDPDAGSWKLHPTEKHTSARRYLPDSLVLETTFTTSTGTVVVTDALLLHADDSDHQIGRRSPHILNRRLQALAGRVTMTTTFAPRMEYGRTTPHLLAVEAGVVAQGGPVTLILTTSVALEVDSGSAGATFTIEPDEAIELRLSSYRTSGTESVRDVAASTEGTTASWQSWAAQHTSYDGAYPDLVRRSSVVLQGLTYAPSGAVVAAATTSLPETMGGDLNWDYRYAWLRDLSLTMRSLWLAACPDEPHRLFGWLAGSTGHLGDELVQIMYGVEGERDLTEHTLEHLSGYRGSAPVRIGNDAWKQKQLDVVGEVLDAAHLLKNTLLESHELEPRTQELLIALADRASDGWDEPDAGMWEARDAQRDYTSSKVMCWVALDRATDLAPHLGPGADITRWTDAACQVRAAVLDMAWSDKLGAYAGAFGSDDLDASVLLLPLVGFLPATDPRMRATIEAIANQLGDLGLVRRWPTDQSGFLICTYWLVECLALLGEHDRASALFEHATSHANDLGLLSEEADPRSRELLGNYPQAFSHVGLINAAWRLGQQITPTPDTTSDDKLKD